MRISKMNDAWHGYVERRAKPKGRPRVTARGTFMPKEYMTAREEFGWLWKSQKPPHFSGPVEVRLGFHTDGVRITLVGLEDAPRPKHVRGDLDNLIGFIMEVMEDIGVVDNDRQVHKIVATCYEAKDE